MKITKQLIGELESRTEELNRLNEYSSELLRTAQDRFGSREHSLTRGGEKVQIAEALLWEEVWHLGLNCEAATILKKEHPEVFEASDSARRAGGNLTRFTLEKMEVDASKMTLAKQLELTRAMVEFVLDERSLYNKFCKFIKDLFLA